MKYNQETTYFARIFAGFTAGFEVSISIVPAVSAVAAAIFLTDKVHFLVTTVLTWLDLEVRSVALVIA